MAVVDCYVRTPEAGADARLRFATLSGLAASAASLSIYGWVVPRDPSTGDALPLSPTGARLRSGGGTDIAVGGAVITDGVGASDGTSTAAAVGAALAAAAASSDGTSTADATGASLATSVASDVGTSTADATGTSVAAAVASSDGTSTALATAASVAAAVASAAGTSTATATGTSSGGTTNTLRGVPRSFGPFFSHHRHPARAPRLRR